MAVGAHSLRSGRVRLSGAVKLRFKLAATLLALVGCVLFIASIAGSGVSAGWLVLPAIGAIAGDLVLLSLSDD